MMIQRPACVLCVLKSSGALFFGPHYAVHFVVMTGLLLFFWQVIMGKQQQNVSWT